MAHDARIAGLLRHFDGLKRLGQAANLVHLDKNGVRAAHLDALGKTLGIRDEQVVAHQLHAIADALGQLLPAVPVLFGHAVFDGDDGVLVDQSLPVVDHFGARQLAAFAGQHVLLLLGIVKLGRSRVHSEHDVGTGLVASSLACLHHVLERLFVRLEVRSETAFIAHAAAKAGIVQNLLQRVVDLSAPAQRFGKRVGADRHDHELLEVHVVVGMRAAVQNVHHGRGKQMRVHTADVLVQRKFGGLCSSLRHGQGRAQDGVRAQRALVVGAVDFQHNVVDEALVVGFHANQGVGDFAVHMSNRIERPLAQIATLIAISQLNSLERASRSTRRHSRAAERTVLQHDLNFHGRIAARVENLATEHIDDDAHECLLVG